jgi:hypothetical protein
MAVNFSVQANVVDINTDTPRPADIFFVDSNVWFWLSYPTASHSAIPYQLSDYPKYVNNSLAAGSKYTDQGFLFPNFATE